MSWSAFSERVSQFSILCLTPERRGQIGESVTNVTKNVTEIITKDKTPEEIIMQMIMDEPQVTQVKIAEVLGVTSRTVKRILAKMQNDGLVTREGSARSGRWIVL